MKNVYKRVKEWTGKDPLNFWLALVALPIVLLFFVSLPNIYAVVLGLSTTREMPPIVLPTPTITTIPTDTPTPTAEPIYVDPDPIIDCVSSYPNCNGSSIRARRSQCSNITCCQVSNNWSVYSTAEKCTEAQKSIQPQVVIPQTTQKTQGNNVYCWDNTNKVGYYTSSGDQCNSNNTDSALYSICQSTQQIKLNSCNSNCKSESDEGKSACAWAYTGSNPGIEQNSDKYGECLNGQDGVGEHYGACIGKCGDQYAEDLKQCN